MFKTPTIPIRGRVLDVKNRSGHGWQPGEEIYFDKYMGNSARSTGHSKDGRAYTINPDEFEVILYLEDMKTYARKLDRLTARVKEAIRKMKENGLEHYSTAKLARIEIYEMLRNVGELSNEDIEEAIEEVLGILAPASVQEDTE